MTAGDHAADKELVRSIRRPYLRICKALGALLAVAVLLSLPIGVTDHQVYSPSDVVGAFSTWWRVTWELVAQNVHYSATEIMGMCPGYYQILARLGVTFIAVVCGAMLALAGSLYQMVFRNPIAAPTMLGVGNGVTLGVAVLVFVYGGSALYMTGMHYLLCYLGALAVLAVVFGVSLALGKGEIVTVDMLLVGTVVSALLGQGIVFLSYCVFDEETWAIFNAVNEVLDVNTEPVSFATLAVAFLASTVPVLVLRFKMNIVAFDAAEMHLSGMNPNLLRGTALVCGTIMIIAAQVHIGTVAMVALVVPFVSRKVFGAEFSRQFWGDILIGAILIVLCEDVTSLVDMAVISTGYSLEFPIGMVANIVTLPLFAWVIAAAQRGWE